MTLLILASAVILLHPRSLCVGQVRGESASRQLEQTEAVAAWPGKAKRWALVIGVDSYKDGQISPLRGAANDARALADALVRYAGFPRDQVILLATDQPEERQPTRLNILRRLSNLASVVPKDGLLLVSFAGHGVERGGHAYLIPSDAQLSDDISFMEDSAVSVPRIKDRIRGTGVGQVVVLLDACRNDPVGRADAPNPLTAAYTKGFNFDTRNSDVQAFAVLYATAVGQRAYEYIEKRQGYFTWAVVEALKGEAANDRGEVTLAALVRYVQELVPKRIAIDLGGGKQQRPFAVIEGYRAEDLVMSVRAEREVTATSTPPAPTLAPDSVTIELAFWDSIKNSANPEDFKAYLRKYPDGQFAGLARIRAQPTRPNPASNAKAERPSTNSNPKFKEDLYNQFRDNHKTKPQAAYEAGKEYLERYSATDGPGDVYVAYIKKWVASYEKISRRNQVIQQLNAKQYNEAFAKARQALVDYPDDLALLFELSKAGLSAASVGNEANNADAVEYAKKTLQMIQAGKTFEPNKPIPYKEQVVGSLNFTLGFLLRRSQPAEAATYFLNAAQSPGFSQKDPNTYALLAVAYEQSEYAKLRDDHQDNCKTEEQLGGAQCTELTRKVNNVVDRMIDALARAVAYSKSSANAAQYEPARAAWMEQLTALYKYRNDGTDAGLNEFIGGITSRPLPRP
ncbi:MAG TPA: caspase family protein [Pyrinomonadaceae bacterium]|nr:caspase family protein [Pyrinomonadaceae bacterium]